MESVLIWLILCQWSTKQNWLASLWMKARLQVSSLQGLVYKCPLTVEKKKDWSLWTFLTHTCTTRWMGWENRWETHTQPSLCPPGPWAANLVSLGQPPVPSVLLEALRMDGVCGCGDKMTLPDHSWTPDRTGQPSSYVLSTFSQSSTEICLSYNCPHYSITLYWENKGEWRQHLLIFFLASL